MTAYYFQVPKVTMEWYNVLNQPRNKKTMLQLLLFATIFDARHFEK